MLHSCPNLKIFTLYYPLGMGIDANDSTDSEGSFITQSSSALTDVIRRIPRSVTALILRIEEFNKLDLQENGTEQEMMQRIDWGALADWLIKKRPLTYLRIHTPRYVHPLLHDLLKPLEDAGKLEFCM